MRDVAEEYTTLIGPYIRKQVKIINAIEEIVLIRVVAQHLWAWEHIGITRWAQMRRRA